jgi:hypothetical protein
MEDRAVTDSGMLPSGRLGACGPVNYTYAAGGCGGCYVSMFSCSRAQHTVRQAVSQPGDATLTP